ncbi:hypothetical protein AAVH_28743 [Aphelenchoides avenae]|nr:hypothetical protein AAVH_28743 [Aphelenchus avenae]
MMLAVESLADVVGFLGNYDLGGLKLANKIFSVMANHCADAIRLFDFSDFLFYISEGCVEVYRRDPNGAYGAVVCQLELSSDEIFGNFVSEAFRNCVVSRLAHFAE